MSTEPDAHTETADTEGASVTVAVGSKNVMAPVATETLLQHPSPHNVSDEHDDGKHKFLFIVIHLRYLIEILSRVQTIGAKCSKIY